MQLLLNNLMNTNTNKQNQSSRDINKNTDKKQNIKMDEQLSQVLSNTRNAISNRVMDIMKSNNSINELKEENRNNGNLSNAQRQRSMRGYDNTFYQASDSPMNNNDHDGNKQQQVYETLSKSKQMIAQMQRKRNNNFGKSNTSIKSGNQDGNGSNKNINTSTKERVDDSLKHIRSHKSIAEEVLYNADTGTGLSAKNKNIRDALNTGNKQDYLNVVHHMFGSSSSKDKRRSSKRKSRNESEQQDEEYTKNRPSKQLFQAQLQQQISRNVSVKGSHHYINHDDHQGDSEENQEAKNRNKNREKQLSRCYQQQLKQVEENIKSKSKIPNKTNQNDQNNSQYLSVSQQRRNNKKYDPNDRGDKISIQIKSTDSLIQNKQQLLDLTLSSSSQDEQYLKKGNNIQQDNILGLLVKQITRDIENLRASSRRNLNSSKHHNEQVTYQINDKKEQQNNQNNNHMNLSINNAMKHSFTYNTNAPSSPSNSDEDNDGTVGDMKNKKSSSQSHNIKGGGGSNGNIPKNKNSSGLYSFRHSEHNNKADVNDLINDIFNIPTEEVNKPYMHKDSQDGHENEDHQTNQEDRRPYCTDHGIGLSQDQVYKMLGIISKRSKYSTIVIDQVPYEHDREDNNQLQIDSRFHKQTRDRDSLIDKVVGYTELNSKYVRYRDNDLFHIVRAENHKLWSTLKSPFKFDQSGHRMMRSQKVWRSPGKNSTEKFISLNTPILNGQSCCPKPILKSGYKNENKTYDDYKSLMMCRSADTLPTLNGSSKCKTQKNKNKKKNVNKFAFDSNQKQQRFEGIHSDCSQQSQNSEMQKQSQISERQQQENKQQSKKLNKNDQKQVRKCLMKENEWDRVKLLRNQLAKKIDDQY